MGCRRFRRYLMRYVEGALDKELAKALEAHLSSCESCSREVVELSRVAEVLGEGEYPGMEPPPDLPDRVMARLDELPAPRSWWVSNKAVAWSAFAAGLILFAFVAVNLRTNIWGIDTSNFTGSRAGYTERPPSHSKLQQGEKKGEGEEGRTRVSSPVISKSIVSNGGNRAGKPTVRTPAKAVTPEPTSPSKLMRSRDTVEVVGKPSEARSVKVGAGPPMQESEDTGFTSKESAESLMGAGNVLVPMSENVAQPPATRRAEITADQAVPEGSTRSGVQSIPGGRQQPQFMSSELSTPKAQKDERITVSEKDPGQSRHAVDNAKIAELERKAREHPTNVTVLQDLQRAYRESGQAKEEYRVAVQLTSLDPDNGEFWFERAQAAERASMVKTAAACYRRALHFSLPPDKAEIARSRLEALETAK